MQSPAAIENLKADELIRSIFNPNSVAPQPARCASSGSRPSRDSGFEVGSAGVDLVTELHAITAALRDAGLRYAIVGGMAVTIHGAVRTTKDIDLLVVEQDIPRILDLLRPLGYIFVALPLTFEAGTARERRIQRVSKIEGGEHLCVDLIITNAIFAGLLDDTIEVQLPEGPLQVLSREGLIRMKRIAGRDQDLADLARLEEIDD